MQQYENALRDADLALCMEPNWIKGLFRKGKALCGLKVNHSSCIQLTLLTLCTFFVCVLSFHELHLFITLLMCFKSLLIALDSSFTSFPEILRRLADLQGGVAAGKFEHWSHTRAETSADVAPYGRRSLCTAIHKAKKARLLEIDGLSQWQGIMGNSCFLWPGYISFSGFSSCFGLDSRFSFEFPPASFSLKC